MYYNSSVQIIPQKENTSKGSLPSKLPNLLASGCKVLVITDPKSEIEELFKSNNLDFTLFAKTSLSSIQDVDMPEAISKFKLEEITLQASQQIFGRLSALSLFDHIQG